jgi:RNA polymerase sigma-70 factor (ECF subfamily)
MNLLRPSRYLIVSEPRRREIGTERVGDDGRMQASVEATEDLIERIALGDRAALEDLYASYRQPLLAYLRLLTSDPGLAEEILQDTLLAVWHGAGGYAPRSSPRGWLFGIARRRARDAMRRRTFRFVDVAALETMPATDPDPEDAALAAAAHEALTAAVARLAPVHRETLVLAFAHGLSHQELAETLGIPVGTVKSRLNAAKRAVRASLEAAGGGGR